jgi:hypothetical protein
MTDQRRNDDGQYVIDVVVEEPRGGSGAADKAGAGGFIANAITTTKVSLTDSVAILGQIASAFSASLAGSEPKPEAVEINFGLEVSAEAGNFVVSKLAGKANFAVKMSWKFNAN